MPDVQRRTQRDLYGAPRGAVFRAPLPGEVHAARMTKWLEFKRRVAAGAGASRMPHMQQFPRYPTKKVTP